MEFDSIPKPEILEYIRTRLGQGADDPTITKEIRAKWPIVISDEGIAGTYIVLCKQMAPPRTKDMAPCPSCNGMPHLVSTCTTCDGNGYILIPVKGGPKE